jgi:hypothetical protein
MAAKKAKKPKRTQPPVVRKEQERADIMFRICAHLRQGDCSIREACRRENVPITTVHDWANADKELAEQYARAREEGLAMDADSIADLAATPCADQLEAASIKLQVDTRKWLVSKRLPKVYGDRQTVEHEGKLTLAQLVEASFRTVENAVPVDGEE